MFGSSNCGWCRKLSSTSNSRIHQFKTLAFVMWCASIVRPSNCVMMVGMGQTLLFQSLIRICTLMLMLVVDTPSTNELMLDWVWMQRQSHEPNVHPFNDPTHSSRVMAREQGVIIHHDAMSHRKLECSKTQEIERGNVNYGTQDNTVERLELNTTDNKMYQRPSFPPCPSMRTSSTQKKASASRRSGAFGGNGEPSS